MQVSFRKSSFILSNIEIYLILMISSNTKVLNNGLILKNVEWNLVILLAQLNYIS